MLTAEAIFDAVVVFTHAKRTRVLLAVSLLYFEVKMRKITGSDSTVVRLIDSSTSYYILS